MHTERLIKKILRPLIPQSILDRRQLNRLKRLAAAHDLELIKHDLFYDLKRSETILRIHDSHVVYLQHMMENFDYFVDSVIPLKVDAGMLVDMSGPRYHRLRGFGDIAFLFPSHTEPYQTTAEYLDFAGLRGGEIVLDIGAYSAVTSIIFGQLVGPSGHVYAFEADESNFECARINVEMARCAMSLKNITLFNMAVWSHNEGVLFSHEGAMGSSAVAITGGNRGLERLVPSIRLQDFFTEHKLSHVDFVKIDIEGCEIKVLEASAISLRALGARLIVEPHSVSGVMSTESCCSMLELAGYRVNVRGRVGESEALIEAIP